MRLFMDTSALIALEDRDDRNHSAALEYRERLREGKTPFRSLYTSNYIIDETLTLLRLHLGHRVAVSFGESVKSSKAVKVFWIDSESDAVAWKIFRAHEDEDFSYTECASFALMEKEAISSAFAFDKHFEQYGFKMFP